MKTIKSYEAAQPQKNVDKIVVTTKSVDLETAYDEDDRGPDKVKGFIGLIVHEL